MNTSIKIQANGTQFYATRNIKQTGEAAYNSIRLWLKQQNKAIDTANGNRYPRTITITVDGEEKTFTSLEFALEYLTDLIKFA